MSRIVYVLIAAVLAYSLLLNLATSDEPNPSFKQNLGGIQITIERLESNKEHVPRQHNIVSSAVRGAGRLARNYTVEAAKFVGTVAKGGVKLVSRTATATGEAGMDSAKRVLPRNFRKQLAPSTTVEIKADPNDELQHVEQVDEAPQEKQE